MPEILAPFLSAAAGGAGELGAAAAPALGEFGGAAAGGLGSFGDLAAAGLPFGAGVGELGSVATGAGLYGASPFTDLLAALGGGAGGLGGSAGLAGMGAGVGDIGTNVAGVGADLGGLGSATLPDAATLTAGAGFDLSTGGMSAAPGGGSLVDAVTPGGGVTSVGPTAGTPAGAVSQGSFTPAGTSAASVSSPDVASSPLNADSGSFDLTSMLKYASPAVAAAALGYNVMQGQKSTATTQAITNQANDVKAQASDLAGQGKALVSHLESGTLPTNIQAKLDEDTKAAKTKIISNYASQGMNTDPNKNSSLRQELASVDRQAQVVSGQLAQQLAASGTNLINAGTQLTGLDNNLLTTLSNIDTTQTAKIGTAISNFAAALNGNKGTTIQIGGQKAA